jgi:hypothetical protein
MREQGRHINDTNFVSVCPHGYAKGPGQAKIGQFQIVAFVDEQILRLQITMEDAV